MPSRPPYIIRTESDEAQADIIDADADLYDPAGAIPEIVGDDGNIVSDPTAIIEWIMDRQTRDRFNRMLRPCQ